MEMHHFHLIHYLQSSSNHSLLNTLDKTDATADGDTSCSSVRFTHTYTLTFILMIKQMPQQMEINFVHQSGTQKQTNTHTLSLSLPLFNNQDNTAATADGDTSC